MIVADASVLVEVLLQTLRGERAEQRLREAGRTCAPHLVDIEVTQVLRRQVQRGLISEARAETALEALGSAPLQRYPQTALLPTIWRLKHNLTAYDATYVALADALEAPLLTFDGRLAAAPGHTARIELVG